MASPAATFFPGEPDDDSYPAKSGRVWVLLIVRSEDDSEDGAGGAMGSSTSLCLLVVPSGLAWVFGAGVAGA